MEKSEKVALLAIGVNLLLFVIKYVFADLYRQPDCRQHLNKD